MMPETRGPGNGHPTPLVPSKWRIPADSGLLRQRLFSIVDDPWQHRLVLVTAPAGSGKTTFLSQLAHSAQSPVAWYRTESPERDTPLMLRYLQAALETALPEFKCDLRSVDGLAAALHDCRHRALLMLDDLQALEGSAAEQALERLLRLLPDNVTLVAASRSLPRFNLSRLRLDGLMTEIDGDALRFRSWEVERLYLDFYQDPLAPEDLACLTRKTNGWAAGLHLFHLATRSQPASVRRTKLQTLNGSSLLVREYLTDNVIRVLPGDLRNFLVETCVLGRLTAPLCDRLLSNQGSSAVLHELEKRQLFMAGDQEDGYRCHDVLRSHLETMLVETIGEHGTRDRFRRAAILLEEAGFHADALYPYLRAEMWDGVHRILSTQGPRLASSPDPWIDLIPPQLRDQSPWLLLGAARRHRQAGRWQVAIDYYFKAEAAFDSQSGRDTCNTERKAISTWLERPLGQPRGWDGSIRLATVSGQPPAYVTASPDPRARTTAGVCALLAGNIHEAEQALGSSEALTNGSEELRLGNRLAYSVARLLGGRTHTSRDLESVVDDADSAGAVWMGWTGRAALALTNREDGLLAAKAAANHFLAENDPWGRAIAGLLKGLGALRRGQVRSQALTCAAGEFRALGATTLEAWCACALAFTASRSQDAGTKQLALEAESLAQSVRLTGPLCLAYEALAVAEPDKADRHLELARRIRDQSGFELGTPAPRKLPLVVPKRPMAIRCFGEFRLSIAGEDVDLTAIKPRARQLLRLLAMHAPNSVHRDVVGNALWPDADSTTVRRNLQVAVSSVRKLLGQGHPGLLFVVRNGDSYRLSLPAGSAVDIEEFERHLAEGKQAWIDEDYQRAAAALEAALRLHHADLLSDEGPAEWVVMERERRRVQAMGAAQSLADAYLAAGDTASAAQACERGLRLDRYQDGLWRRLLTAHHRAGNQAAEAKARRTYLGVLAELGLAGQPAS